MALRAPSQVSRGGAGGGGGGGHDARRAVREVAVVEEHERVDCGRSKRCEQGGAEGEGGLPAELVQGLNSLMHRARRAAERQPPAHRGTDERDDERDGEETERRDGEHLVGGLQRDAVRAALAGSRARRDAVEKGVVREPDEDGDDRREGVEVADQELELRRAVGGVAWARCNRQATRCGYAPPAP